jgi:hypothetical protein
MVQIGDMTIQDEAVVLPANKSGSITRDISVATGTVAYTGVGFKPSAMSFNAVQHDNDAASWGYDDGTTRGCSFRQQAGSGLMGDNTTQSIHLLTEPAGGAGLRGTVSSFDSDGFTMSWVNVGSPPAKASPAAIFFMAFK